MAQSASRKRKLVEDSTAGSKRNKESLVSFSGDDLEREENVPEGEKFPGGGRLPHERDGDARRKNYN